MVMYLMGFTLNNLSLMALTLSVGFVVDDAIVMLENIVRHREMGEGRHEAATKGSREIGFTILSMTLSLSAVFIPVLFMPGIVGRLLHEFALTIGVSILISGFVSLSLTPMLCSRFLRPPGEAHHGRLYAMSESVFQGMFRVYDVTLKAVLRHRRMTMIVSFIIIALTAYLFVIIPKGFLPNEDVGRIMVSTEAAQGISYDSMVTHQQALAKIIARDPNVESFMSRASNSNTGGMFIALKPREQRKLSAEEVIQELRPKLATVPGIQAFMQIPPTIPVGGQQSKSQYQFTMQCPDSSELYHYAPLLEAKMRTMPEIQDIASDLLIKNPQVNVNIDRDKASALGVSVQQIESALFTAYGSGQISTILAPNNQYQVIMELAPEYQTDPGALGKLYVRSSNGTLVPLNTVAKLTQSVGPPFDQSPGAVSVGNSFVQPQAGSFSRRGNRGGSGRRVPDFAEHDQREFSGDGSGFCFIVPGAGHSSHHGDYGHLYRAGNSLREFHPSPHDFLGASLGRIRRTAHLARFWQRPGSLRVRRNHHAGGVGEEKRNHDDRLRH